MEKHYTKKLKIILHSKIFYWVWILFVLFFVRFHLQNPYRNIIEEEISFEGKIIEYRWNDQDEKVELILKNKKGKELVFYSYQKELKEQLKKEIRYGVLIKGIGKKIKPSNNTIPNTFNYCKYLKSIGYDYFIESRQISYYDKSSYHDKIHDYLRKRLDEKKEAIYYKTFLLGIKENWNQNTDKIFRENGISHLFVISGMHLGFLFSFLKSTIQRFSEKKKIQFLFAFIVLTFYYSFLTKSLSSERAYGFFLLLTLNELMNFNCTAKQLYLINVGLQLFKNPFLLFNIGFQYSFSLSFSFLFFSQQEKSKWKKILKKSLFAFLISFPITLNQSFTLNPWSIFNNIIMIPFVSGIVMPLLFFSLFFPYFENGVSFLLRGMEWWNTLFYNFPFSHISVPKMSFILFLCYYFCLFISICFKKRKILFFWCIFWLFSIILPKFNSTGYIYFLDVGQGDCTLIISPYQKEVILIDTGNENENLKNNIVLFLKSIGIQKINYLILSHGDLDHTGNALEFLKTIKVEKILLNEGEKNEIEQKIETSYKEKIVKTISTKLLTLTKLSHEISNNENDNSIILHACIYKTCTLFLGDASNFVEEEILNNYKIKATILKVAHHGSKTSTSEKLLKEIPFQYGVISVGKKNSYSMPHKSVTEKLKKHHINLLETRSLGTICFKIKKNQYTIFSFPP